MNREQPAPPRIAVIGPGKVGTTLAILLERSRLHVDWFGARDPARAAEAASYLVRPPAVCPPEEAVREADLVLLTVQDDAIEPVCSALAKAGGVRPGSAWLHCSGALPGSVMANALHHFGCPVGSMHPLQTFPTVEAGVARLPGALVACEGEPNAVSLALRLAKAIGGRPIQIGSDRKQLYHAAAVLACNGLVALVDAALTLTNAAGLPESDARAGLSTILETTLDNIERLGTTAALTGPAARGDAATLNLQYAALRSENGPVLAELYRAINLQALAIAQRSGRLTLEQAEKARSALTPSGTGDLAQRR
ncbi:MAG: DUF2520 domain-containing protein [Verrucomicrobiota bacterium]|jgi:predicted short-subunit dehydrogenase-like oxidoreductase (DUF2520 family)|nr:DUF2520 domain-containing protein [Verrucomicrobiota bacterium]MDD8044974.1 DUF2520 domain-containing protein [Verrucomicrobiota bacterium]MDI9384651.1 DUF2520 domain-containing protein [Verrucomicrobiota bacterium]